MTTITPAVKSLTRACAAAAISAFGREAPNRVIAREWSDDANAQWLMRAATSPTDIGTAPAIVRTLVPDFVAALAGQSAAARIFQDSLQLAFGDSGRIAVPTIIGNPNYAAFVGESDPIPVVQGFVEPLVMLTPKKLASIVVFTEEMIRSSNIEALMTDALVRSTALALDQALFDDQPEDAVRPAGLRYGKAALAASSAPEAFDALVSDVETLNSTIEATTPLPPLFVMSPAKALTTGLRTNRNLASLFGSHALRGTEDVIAIAPDSIAVVFGKRLEIDAKRGAVTIHTDNAPMPLVANDGTPAAPMLSAWQADCVAVKVRWPVTWALRSPDGVAWLTAQNW